MSDTAAAKFILRIDGLSLEDIPMRRLAEYLALFAELLGEDATLHSIRSEPDAPLP
jgi:hypothetical protein